MEETKKQSSESRGQPSNEYVLNFAFYSFVGFVACQTGFALIANSESMLADSESMAVDALTYLFNLWAEHLKKQPIGDAEDGMSEEVRAYRTTRRRLWLELVSPAISVITLLAITVMTMHEAIGTLFFEADGADDDVSISIMLWFSAANLILDFVNITCFARAGSMFDLSVMSREKGELQRCASSDSDVLATESSSLVPRGDNQESDNLLEDHSPVHFNMNMCSAWTHIFADTMRSASVLVSAGAATIFPVIPPAAADSVAAIAVSVIIVVSLIPLLQRLTYTALEISILHRHRPQS